MTAGVSADADVQRRRLALMVMMMAMLLKTAMILRTPMLLRTTMIAAITVHGYGQSGRHLMTYHTDTDSDMVFAGPTTRA